MKYTKKIIVTPTGLGLVYKAPLSRSRSGRELRGELNKRYNHTRQLRDEQLQPNPEVGQALSRTMPLINRATIEALKQKSK